MSDLTSAKIGDKVEIFNDGGKYAGHNKVHACYGEVMLTTATQVSVKNEHGNISIYKKKTGRTHKNSSYICQLLDA